jgi:hypothetical protein
MQQQAELFPVVLRSSVAIMTNITDSEAPGELDLEPLQLDIRNLQQQIEEDKREFQDFCASTTRNFDCIQKNLDKIQEKFRKLFARTIAEPTGEQSSDLGQASTVTTAPRSETPQGRPKQLHPSPSIVERPQSAPHGSATMQDHQGKVLIWMALPRFLIGNPTML